MIPAARRRFEIGRLVGLALGSETLRGELRRRQCFLVEPGRNLIALLGGVVVTVRSGQCEPPVGFRQIGLNANAAGKNVVASSTATPTTTSPPTPTDRVSVSGVRISAANPTTTVTPEVTTAEPAV